MELSKIFEKIASLYDISNTYPNLSTTEGLRRLELVNSSLDDYRYKFNWLSLRRIADLSTVANQEYVDLPNDIDNGRIITHKNGLIFIDGEEYPLVFNLDEIEEKTYSRYTWLSKNNDVYRLNIYPTPTSAVNFRLRYQSVNAVLDASNVYKKNFTDLTDRTIIEYPEYVIYMVLSNLYTTDDDVAKGQMYESKAQSIILTETRKQYINELGGSTYLTNVHTRVLGK